MYETSILDSLDWKILLTYDRQPFQSYNAISKIVGVHHSTVSDRIDSMKDRNILRQDIEANDIRLDPNNNQGITYVKRQKSEVIGNYSPARMGLTRTNIIFKHVKSHRDMEILIKFVDDHPYTHYYAPLYGQGLNLFAQFDIPIDAISIHYDTFNSLKGDYIDFGEIGLFQDIYESRTDVDLETQVRESSDSGRHDNNSISILWDDFLDNRKDNIFLEKPIQEKKFDNLDAELIREIGINGKLNISNLTDYYSRDKSTLSRRMSKIKEHFVTDAVLMYGNQASLLHGFQNRHIITGKLTGENNLNEENFIKFIDDKTNLPFHSFLAVEDNAFLLYTRSTVGVVGDLMEFLSRNTDPNLLNQYQFYLSNSRTFPFWYGNYDENDGFNVSREYIKDEPLEVLKNYKPSK